MRQHVSLPYLRESTRSGVRERRNGLRETDFFSRKKNSVRVATIAEKTKGKIVTKLT